MNGQFVSAIVAANVGIFGVWLTIHRDKQARFKERLDQIKPALSIRYDTVYEVNNREKEGNTSVKSYLNPYAFSFLPLLSDGQYIPGSPIFMGYIPNAGKSSDFDLKMILAFEVHVDGNFPVTDIKVTKIFVVGEDDPDKIRRGEQLISIGEMPRLTGAVFDFYHQHDPKNFEKIERLFMGQVAIDTNMLEAYISPGEDIKVEVPVVIGITRLSTFIEVMKSSIFNDNKYKIECNYPFETSGGLAHFLFNLKSIPVQTAITFEYKDVDDNIYTKKFQCFSSITIVPTDDMRGKKDYIISGKISTIGSDTEPKLDWEEFNSFVEDKYKQKSLIK